MAKNSYRVFRIDPKRKAIAALPLNMREKNFSLTIQRMTRAAVLGHRLLCEHQGQPLYIAADAQAPDGQHGFRFKGVEGTTSGVGVLFGQGDGGGLVDAPIDREWIERRIVWTEPGETDADDEEEFEGGKDD